MPLLLHLLSFNPRLYLLPYLVEDVEVRLHLRREKVQLSITLSCGRDEPVSLEGTDMVLGDAVVDVEGFCETVDVVRFFS